MLTRSPRVTQRGGLRASWSRAAVRTTAPPTPHGGETESASQGAPCTCSWTRVRHGRYFVIWRWSPVPVAGLPLPTPPLGRPPPSHRHPSRCSRRGWEPLGRHRRGKGWRGPPTAASQASRHSPTPTPTLGGIGARGPALPAGAAPPPLHGEGEWLLIAPPSCALRTALKAQIILTTVPHLSPVLFGKQPLSCCTKKFLWLSSRAGR